MSSCSRSPASTLRSPAALAEIGVSVVSVGDLLDDTNELLALDDVFRGWDATLVVGAAMSPGLSGLIARHLASQLASFRTRSTLPCTGRPVRRALANTTGRWPGSRRVGTTASGSNGGPGAGGSCAGSPNRSARSDCHPAELTDPLLLHLAFPDVVRISARVSATRRDRLTSSLPMLRTPHAEGLDGALRVEVRGADPDGGRQTVIAGIAERAGTAAAAMAAAFAGELDGRRIAVRGGRQRRRRTRHGSLLAAVERYGVRLQEFTGVAQRG